MNSLSEPAQRLSNTASAHASRSASFVPMEYRDAGAPFHSEDDFSRSVSQSSTPEDTEPAPDPAALLAARIEEERRTITAQARKETEREIQLARAAIAQAIEQFAQQRDEYFRLAEAEVVDLALAIARRIIHRECQVDPRLLAGLVNYELEQLEASTSVRLIVSPEAMRYWSDAAPAMSRSVEVSPDKSLAPGSVRIEAALGSTSVSFERELKEIERGFLDLLSHRPATAEAAASRIQ